MRKSLGQHFLLNPVTLEQIVAKAGIGPSDEVLEVGPGSGGLTRKLAEKAERVITIEKDKRLIPLLQRELADLKNIALVEADFLDIDLEKTLLAYSAEAASAAKAGRQGFGGRPASAGRWKVVANLPYNVATEVIFFLLQSSHLFQSFHLMVQREVGNRICAAPGSKDYGILSVFCQLMSENKIVMKLPPGAFTPPPKVDSALVEFKIQKKLRYDIRDLSLFKKVVRGAFSQRRKMIQNSLKSSLKDHPPEKIREALREAGIEPTARAEQVPIERFARLANQLAAIA